MEDSKKRKNHTINIDKPPTPKRQSDIGGFFRIHHKKDTASNSNKESDLKKNRARNLKTATTEKWKSTTLEKYNADDWLVVNLVKLTNCSVCTKFMGQIFSIKNFQQQWCKGGSKRLQDSAALEHVESMSHEKAFDLHLKRIGLGIREQAEKEQLLLSSTGQQSIVHNINVMNEKDFKQTKKKFEKGYFLTKNKAHLSLFQKLMSRRKAQCYCIAYHNRTLVTLFLEYVAENLRKGLKKKLNMRKFYSLLTNGSTDSAVNEKEAFFV